MTPLIKHKGIVEHIAGEYIQVRIVQTSACSTCSIKGHCNASESKEKLIDVYLPARQAQNYYVGEEVMVCGSTKMGISAVCYAFVIPFIALIVTLVLCLEVFMTSEPVACLAVLVLLAIYFLTLRFMRDRLSKKFTFSIESINN